MGAVSSFESTRDRRQEGGGPSDPYIADKLVKQERTPTEAEVTRTRKLVELRPKLEEHLKEMKDLAAEFEQASAVSRASATLPPYPMSAEELANSEQLLGILDTIISIGVRATEIRSELTRYE